jgi:hypothetical protein
LSVGWRLASLDMMESPNPVIFVFRETRKYDQIDVMSSTI